ncbi:MAG TPA: amino acid ABC transporter permease [Acetobacteraceae bacterium]
MFDLGVFLDALTGAPLLWGLATTLGLAVLVQAAALAACLPLALASSRWGRGFVHGYVWVFRGTPTLLVLLLAWNGLPQLIPALKSDWYTPFAAAFLALTLVQVAYLAEIMRSALLSVPKGQRETAAALGLHRVLAFRLVVLPQAMRVALPPLANEFITLLKATSLASVISLRELMTVAGYAISASFRFLEWYSAALVYYLVLVGAIGLVQAWVERRMRG